MRSRPRILGTLFGALLLAATVSVAFAQPGPPPEGRRGMHGPGGRDGRDVVEFLQLTDQQREAWRDAHRAHFESLKPTIEKIRDLREQLGAELEEASPDAATVGGYVIAIHQTEAEFEAARGDLDAALAEILTDEQEAKLEAYKAANPDRHHGPGFGGPGGPHGRRDHGGPDRDDDDA